MYNWLKRNHKKIQEIGIGLFLYETFNTVYDFIFYPLVLTYFGFVDGGCIAIFISLIINAFVFVLYEYMQVDWLGANALRELNDSESKTRIEKMLTWIGRKKTTLLEKLTSPLVFIGLTLPIDPVIVAVHYRRQHFKGITWRDWSLLVAATITANCWWLIKIGAIVEAIKFIWHLIF